MLISFSVVNFMSFKDKVEFDMHPVGSEAKLHKSELYDKNVAEAKTSYGKKLPLLLSSAIYGANASGKTSFIKAIRCMREIVITNNPSLPRYIKPFRLNEESATRPSEFQITILAEDNVIYEYGFAASQDIIHKEWLYAYPKGRVQKLFERVLKDDAGENPQYDYQFSGNLLGNKSVWSEATTPQRLFLSTAIQLNNKQLKAIYNWFDVKALIIESASPMEEFARRRIAVHYLSKKPEQKKEIIDFLAAADFALADIKAQEEGESEQLGQMLSLLLTEQNADSDKAQQFFSESYEISTYHMSQDKKIVKFDFNEESIGTQKMFDYSALLIDRLRNGGTVFIDELNNSLHPLLVYHIIRMFHNKKTNLGKAQFVFTTHEPSLLNEDDLLRRDQIWFCSKNKHQDSQLYSLDEFKLRKDIINIESRYLSGRYGGVPFVGHLPSQEEEE